VSRINWAISTVTVTVTVLLQLPYPTPTIFTFPSQTPNDPAPSLSIFSPGGTGRAVSPGLTPPGNPQPSPLSPSRGYCPAVRGLAPVTPGGLGVLTAPGAAARSPSVNRLGSLFNSINRSVTSAFSNFVAVNQPVPGVIQDYDQSTPPQPRPQFQPRFPAPSRRGSANQESTTALTLTNSSLQIFSRAPGSSESTTQGQWGVQQPLEALTSAAGQDPDGRLVPGRVGPLPLLLPRAPGPRRPRGGLPIQDASEPAPFHTDELSNHNFIQRATSLDHPRYDNRNCKVQSVTPCLQRVGAQTMITNITGFSFV